jgi:outer membrane protein
MNRIATIVACALLATLPAAPAARAETPATPKIGVIEVQRIIQESAIGKEALAKIQKLQQSKQEELSKRQKELRDLEQRIQQQGKTLSEDAMEKLQKDYQAKAVDLKRFQDDAQRDLEEAQRKELKTLEERIMPVIDTIGKEMGYNLIFNKFNSGLLFASDDTDITNAIITRFNMQIAAPATGTKPAAAGTAPSKPAAPAPTPAPKKN